MTPSLKAWCAAMASSACSWVRIPSSTTSCGTAVFAEGNMWSRVFGMPLSSRTREPKSSEAMSGMWQPLQFSCAFGG